jgi:ABC-type transport system involved in multi-copper enzyme maturation permease subunit
MLDVVRAELFKLVRRPAAWVLLATAAVLNQVFGYLIPYLSFRSGGSSDVAGEGATPEQLLASTLPDQLVANTIGAFPVFAGALALVLGALVFGGEYGWGTVKTMLTQRPGRATVVGGQLVAVAVALLAAVTVLFAAGAASAGAIALAEGQTITWSAPAVLAQGFGAGALVLFMWASLGGVLGVVLRGVALPIGLGVVWVLGVENLLSVLAGSMLSALRPVRDVLPGVNAGSVVSAVMPDRMVEAPPGVTSTVGEPRALLTLACYVLVCSAVTAWATSRRDVV